MDLRGHGRAARRPHGDLSMRSMGRDIAAVLDAVAPGPPRGGRRSQHGGAWRPSRWPSSARAVRESRRGRGPHRHVVLRPRPGGDGLRRRSRASPARIAPHRRRARRSAPQGGAREPGRPSGRRRSADAVRSRRAAPPGRPRRAARRARVDRRVDRRVRRSSWRWTCDTRCPRLRFPRSSSWAITIVSRRRRAAVELAGDLPDASFVVVEGAGHIAMLERPVELDREIRVVRRASVAREREARAGPGRREAAAEAARWSAHDQDAGRGRRRGVRRARNAGSPQGRTQVVFGVGDPHADLMFIGEGPGFHEDKQGEPFVGAAGQLLTRMLGEIGLAREQVYIANIVKCRPPGQPRPAARRDRGMYAVAGGADLARSSRASS